MKVNEAPIWKNKQTMTDEPEQSLRAVSTYVPPRPPPTKANLRAERKLGLSRPFDWDDWHTKNWYLKQPKHKFLLSGLIWILCALLAWLIVWSDIGGSVSGVPILIALLGWPVPLFYLTKWLWQELRNK